VDLNYGKSLKMFGTNIAHGILVLSFASGVVGSRLVGQGVALMGIKNAAFKNAVKIDDRIAVAAVISKKYSAEVKGQTRYYIDIFISITLEDSGAVAAEGTSTVMVFNKSRP
ncbi:MAG: hypothetical protein LUQ65_04310, partial [Candidatus Helarchaeota archaeon]|nr:hypothetical protein [Candidatus Helarchaeota archaeon]